MKGDCQYPAHFIRETDITVIFENSPWTLQQRILYYLRKSSLGLRDQICEMVSSAITSQTLSPDKRLPSCRELADQLGVSRNTVFSAYGRLMDLGLLVARDRSGYFVNPIALSPTETTRGQGHHDSRGDAPAPVSFESFGLEPVDNPLDWTSYPYPFIYNRIRFDPGRSWLRYRAGAVRNRYPELKPTKVARLAPYAV